jgi:hypothetical protein
MDSDSATAARQGPLYGARRHGTDGTDYAGATTVLARGSTAERWTSGTGGLAARYDDLSRVAECRSPLPLRPAGSLTQ